MEKIKQVLAHGESCLVRVRESCAEEVNWIETRRVKMRKACEAISKDISRQEELLGDY